MVDKLDIARVTLVGEHPLHALLTGIIALVAYPQRTGPIDSGEKIRWPTLQRGDVASLVHYLG